MAEEEYKSSDPELQRWLVEMMAKQKADFERCVLRSNENLRQYIELKLKDHEKNMRKFVKPPPAAEGAPALVAQTSPRSHSKEPTPSEEPPLIPLEYAQNESPNTGTTAPPVRPVLGVAPGADEGPIVPGDKTAVNGKDAALLAKPGVAIELDKQDENSPPLKEVEPAATNGSGVGGESPMSLGHIMDAAGNQLSSLTGLAKFKDMHNRASFNSADGEDDGESPIKQFIAWAMGAPLDILAGILIFASTLVTFMHLQWKGYVLRTDLCLEFDPESYECRGEFLEEKGGWPGAEQTFIDLELFFATVFLIELVVRLAYFKLHFLADKLNVLDMVVVIITSCDTFIFSQMENVDGGNPGFMRMIRYAKLVRTLRFVRAMKFCHPLRVLIRTIASSFMALFWSMLILVAFMLMSALFLCQTLQEFIADPSANMEHKLWVEKNYGNAAKALWTMTEITFSGGWPTWVRPLIENVSVWYAVFFSIYVGGVVFAVIRIITALFLKDTLSVAANDSEMMMQQKLKEKAQFAAKLEEVFREADTTGDGMISWAEFHALLTEPKAKAYLASLELETHEIESMFTLLDDGDGEVSFDEFLSGVIRLKGQARSQDVLALLHDNRKILKEISTISDVVTETQKRAQARKRTSGQGASQFSLDEEYTCGEDLAKELNDHMNDKVPGQRVVAAAAAAAAS